MTDVQPDPAGTDLREIEAQRTRIRDQHLRPAGDRPASAARGLHHNALISSDVERTVRFYQDLLGFPLTELIDNRDYPGSSHFFFDIGNRTCWPSSTSPASTWAPTPRSSAACTTWPSRWSPHAGTPSSPG